MHEFTTLKLVQRRGPRQVLHEFVRYLVVSCLASLQDFSLCRLPCAYPRPSGIDPCTPDACNLVCNLMMPVVNLMPLLETSLQGCKYSGHDLDSFTMCVKLPLST